MKNIILAFCLALGMSFGLYRVHAQSPVVYSESNINLVSPGVYETYNCAGMGCEVWVDSTYTAYQWSTGATTPRIQLPGPGTAQTVTVTVTNSMGNSYFSVVNANAVASANQQVIYPLLGTETCAGDSLAIGTHFTAGFQTLIWSWGPVITNTWDCDIYMSGACYMYSHSATENSYTRITSSDGCQYPSFPQTLMFFPHPAPPTITQSNDTLYATPGSPRYVWYDGSMTVIPGATATWYKPATAGTYYVKADGSFSTPVCLSGVSSGYSFSPGGCGASYTWQPDTTGQFSILVLNQCTPTPANGGTYVWDFGDGNTSTQAYPQHQYAGAGTYHVCVTVSFSGCTQTYCDSIVVTNKVNAPFTINVVDPNAPVGVVSPLHFDARVWPNPSTGVINLDVLLENDAEVGMRLFSMDGRAVMAFAPAVFEAGTQSLSMQASGLASGMYVVELKVGGEVARHRVVLQR